MTSANQGRKQKGQRKKLSINDKVDLFLFLLLALPVLYGVIFILFSGIVNSHWYTVQECTIKGVGISKQSTRSYSSSKKIVVATTDCGRPFEYRGPTGGSSEEFVRKGDSLIGQKVDIAVGNWQLPLSLRGIYAVEGLTPHS